MSEQKPFITTLPEGERFETPREFRTLLYPNAYVFRGGPKIDRMYGALDAIQTLDWGSKERRAYATDIYTGFALHTFLGALNRSMPDDLVEELWNLTEVSRASVNRLFRFTRSRPRGIGAYGEFAEKISQTFDLDREINSIDETARLEEHEANLLYNGYLENAPITFAEIASWQPR